jgi:hypothetical protein
MEGKEAESEIPSNVEGKQKGGMLDLKNNIRCTMVNSNEEKIKSFKKSIYKK